MTNREMIQNWSTKNQTLFVQNILNGKQHCDQLHLPKVCKKYRHNCEKCREAWLNAERKDK